MLGLTYFNPMIYQDLVDLNRIMYNNISYEDFVAAGSLMNYSVDYIDTIWLRWSHNRLSFLTTHEMGKIIFEMICRKIEAEKILNT